MDTRSRTGIAAGGNWIVDRVKTVDVLPGRGMLANIQSESVSTGGAPANVLEDLARLGAGFPLSGYGVVGRDEDGTFIREKFRKLGVDISGIHTHGSACTSYTDVMSKKGTGDRSFFHNRGANALFAPDSIDTDALECRIFHLGYLLLLDRLDEQDDEYGTCAARLLHSLQHKDIATSADLVSEEGERFMSVVPPALPYINFLIINEVEAGRVAGVDVRDGQGELKEKQLMQACEKLADMGNSDLITVHMPEGAYAVTGKGERFSRGSLDLPDGYIAGATGAGDAFCAGMLYGIHEEYPYETSLEIGVCAAAASLSQEDAGSGMKPLEDVLELGKRYGFRSPPI